MNHHVTLFTAILASGLALALSREHRIRRAFQTLASRLLDRLRKRSTVSRSSRPFTTTTTSTANTNSRRTR